MSAPAGPPAPSTVPPSDREPLTTAALCLLLAAAAWYLLRELAPLLRPLLLAILLCYVVLPSYLRLRRRMPGPVAVVVLAVGSVAVLFLLALMLYSSAVELNQDMPRWVERLRQASAHLRHLIAQRIPSLAAEVVGTGPTELHGAGRLSAAANALVSAAADVLGESFIIGFYLLFLLMEARRLPQRVQSSFTGPRADEILAVMRNINLAMASYLRVKVKASLLLAVPVTVVLWALDVQFPLMWGVLTFAANFVPYLGSVFACSLPILLAFLETDGSWRPISVAVLLIGLHLLSAYVVEPAMTGRAVGLSPLVILLALAFWGLCWGLIGMVLAVPLTVMLKIIMDNVAFTRPIARLMGEE